MLKFKHLFTIMAGLGLIMSMAGVSAAYTAAEKLPAQQVRQSDELTQKVQHSLIMLPYYGVFDELTFSIDGDTVILAGEVRRANLKIEAETAVKDIDTVKKVVNNIEVLPLSRMDDSIRLNAYYAIFSNPGFDKYVNQDKPPIKIIVKNGNIRLGGVVLNEFDKTTAELAANSVRYVFSVTNNLTIG